MAPSMSLPLLLCSSLFLAACATPLSNGRAQDMVPASFSAAYSELGMRLQLATAAKGDPCADFGCGYALAFDMQVLRLGSRLSKVYRLRLSGHAFATQAAFRMA